LTHRKSSQPLSTAISSSVKGINILDIPRILIQFLFASGCSSSDVSSRTSLAVPAERNPTMQNNPPATSDSDTFAPLGDSGFGQMEDQTSFWNDAMFGPSVGEEDGFTGGAFGNDAIGGDLTLFGGKLYDSGTTGDTAWRDA
jgi:hypothetical protein